MTETEKPRNDNMNILLLKVWGRKWSTLERGNGVETEERIAVFFISNHEEPFDFLNSVH